MKTALAGGVVAVALVAAAPVLMAGQDGPQAQQRRGPGGPGMRGGAGGQMRGPGGPAAFGPEFRYLGLSEDQRVQLRKIREARQAEFREAGQKIRTAREGLRALVQADTLDESAVRAKSAEVAAVEADLAILNAKVRQESMQILTAEQQAKLKELRAARSAQPNKRRKQ
jgi:Spy/CpxP family protein refolding chaperone